MGGKIAAAPRFVTVYALLWLSGRMLSIRPGAYTGSVAAISQSRTLFSKISGISVSRVVAW